ncbi:SNF2-related protein [Ensifer sp. YR511]|uniref:SNF2-related protein n=1 Tax=Ensifer sp. YR511 TaxID=1855294 RepID=UPI0008810B3C|nr:SNF2-related protein [Ensifer sp. YR511]SDN52976.1 Helicase conserved C-terminal domain-containing protein [Ensifer sp. YR511]
MTRFKGWDHVATILRERANQASDLFNDGQRASLHAIADRLAINGIILADEVGMGKTRVAVAVTHAVVAAGGRVALAIPPGLDFQWQEELRAGGVFDTLAAIRSMNGYLDAWPETQASQPWFNQSVVVVSHRFGNWRFGQGRTWRWQLLPMLYAHWQKKQTGRFPRNSYIHDDKHWDTQVKRAALSIFDGLLSQTSNAAAKRMGRVAAAVNESDIMRSESYGRHTTLRHYLEQVVGLGLGVFDLVVIDEAHKSRGDTSGLERLLENMIVASPTARRLAITATPVELGVSQWEQILKRINADNVDEIKEVVKRFGEAIAKVRLVWRSDANAREEFAEAAGQFQSKLSRYLLRRDKREEEAVLKFVSQSKEPFDAYRREQEIIVTPDCLSPEWKRAICAAEALSFTATGDDAVAKRLRLTLGNGHGVSAMLDQAAREAKEDKHQEDFDEQQAEEGAGASKPVRDTTPVVSGSKRAQRIDWWQKLIASAFADGDSSLYGHPAILAAVEEIEAYTMKKQKVLVFGRFTTPLRAITALLNARAMLRALEIGEAWPQAKVHAEELKVVWAAHRQLNSSLNIDKIDELLAVQYRQIESRREKLRENMYSWIIEGLGSENQFELSLINAAMRSTNSNVRPLLARAIDELIDDSETAGPEVCAAAFKDLMNALRDRANEGNNPDALWPSLEQSLVEEYDFQRGTFCRLMYGGTAMPGRRALQLAFNRERSFPNVLVAQSMVGREGLNLHHACRVVVLLHPEWNPGVVEQQIGRVDRLGSRWSKDLDKSIEDGSELPRIEIRPVVFAGTYDDHNWSVLRARWSELRAQLHGVIIDPRHRDDALTKDQVEWLEKVAPNFSPTAPNHPMHLIDPPLR